MKKSKKYPVRRLHIVSAFTPQQITHFLANGLTFSTKICLTSCKTTCHDLMVTVFGFVAALLSRFIHHVVRDTLLALFIRDFLAALVYDHHTLL